MFGSCLRTLRSSSSCWNQTCSLLSCPFRSLGVRSDPLCRRGVQEWKKVCSLLIYTTSFTFAFSPCRYCGERSQFVVASANNKIEVRFHSDQSYTDTGFSAEYLSYDSSDREWKP